LADGQTVSARVGVAGRKVIFGDVLVRVGDDMALELHIDVDEANACGARAGDEAEIIIAGGAATPNFGGRLGRKRARPLVTEADVIAAFRRGVPPVVDGALLTPWAKEALRRYFPALAAERL